MTTETYKNAPITEAALDIRVRLPKDVTVDVLEHLKDENYPTLHDQRVNVEVKLNVAEQAVDTVKKAIGFAYKSPDGRQLFQARTDGFTHNRLRPYQEWPLFAAEARRLWRKYKDLARPEMIELLGLNYVNHIFVPHGVDFSEYLRVYLEVPSELPQQLNALSFGFQATWPKSDGILTYLGQAIGPPIKEGFATLVLSIQAFRPLQRPAAEIEEEKIWATFEQLREIKNAIFEACITDKVREEIR